MDVIVFKGMVLWRVQLSGLSVMDIIVGCGMILLFMCRIWCREITSHVNNWILYYYCAVSSLAKISADAVARWVTMAAVEKVGRVPCHTSGLL